MELPETDQVRSFSHFSHLQTSHLPPYCSLMPKWDVLDFKWSCYENLLMQNKEPKNPSPR